MTKKLFNAIVLIFFFFCWKPSTAQTCQSGSAGSYSCFNVDLYKRIGLGALSSTRGNDSWGWVSPSTNKPYVLMGLNNGMAVVDISVPDTPIYIGRLPKHSGSSNSTWRDIKVYKNHAYVVSEASNHGMQILDLTQLDTITNVNLPRVFTESGHYNGFSNAHNIVINEQSGRAYGVGTNKASGGLHALSLSDPITPSLLFNYSSAPNRYTHDAQVVYYHGPDKDHQGKELAFLANAALFKITDVTNPGSITDIATSSYPRTGYTHQGWLSPDHKYWYMNDELDEKNIASVTKTRTLVWNITDLDNPFLDFEHKGVTGSIDHNLYTKGNYIYQANYTSGLRILDANLIECDSLREVAYFDTYSSNNGANFNGSWSNYPYFDSVVAISNIGEGLFLVRPTFNESQSELSISANPDPVEAGAIVTFTLSFSNPISLGNLKLINPIPVGLTYQTGSGGSLIGTNIEFNIGSYSSGSVITRKFECLVPLSPFSLSGSNSVLLSEDAEISSSPFSSGSLNGLTSWSRSSADPNNGSQSWCAAAISSAEATHLIMDTIVILTGYNQILEFSHKFDFSFNSQTNRDGGIVEISRDGTNWEPGTALFTTNGYSGGMITSTTNPRNGNAAFTGSSNGVYIQSSIDLSNFSGYTLQIRFIMATDSADAPKPWYIDDIEIVTSSGGTPVFIEESACASNSEGENASARIGLQIIPSSAPLPIPELSLSGAADLNSFLLTWDDLNEADNVNYSLLKKSEFENRYSEIYGGAGQGKGIQLKARDEQIEEGIHYYYKVRQDLEDGQIAFSNTVKLILENKDFLNISLSPVPAGDKLNVNIYNSRNRNGIIEIRTIQGKLVRKTQLYLTRGNSTKELDLSALSSGVYVLNLKSGTSLSIKKFIKI